MVEAGGRAAIDGDDHLRSRGGRGGAGCALPLRVNRICAGAGGRINRLQEGLPHGGLLEVPAQAAGPRRVGERAREALLGGAPRPEQGRSGREVADGAQGGRERSVEEE